MCVVANCLDKCIDEVRDQDSILETKIKTTAVVLETKTKTVKILPQDCLETDNIDNTGQWTTPSLY